MPIPSLPALAAEKLGYCRIAELGGLRKRRKGGATSPNAYWENLSFRNYADYAATAEFRSGLAALRKLAAQHRPAIMCAEAVWWRCHRRIIADYLLAAGADVRHILAHGKIEPAHMTESAVLQPDGSLIYPAQDLRPSERLSRPATHAGRGNWAASPRMAGRRPEI